MRKVHSLRDAREICADGTYFPNNLRKWIDETRNQCETYTDGDQKSKVEWQLPYLDLSTDDSKRTGLFTSVHTAHIALPSAAMTLQINATSNLPA